MQRDKINMFMVSTSEYFPDDKLFLVREKLENVPDDALTSLSLIQYRSPLLMLAISLLGGPFGIDRFMIGDTGMGILKLLTGGCCGVLTIIDWFVIMGRTRDENLIKFMNAVNTLGASGASSVSTVNNYNIKIEKAVQKEDKEEKSFVEKEREKEEESLRGEVDISKLREEQAAKSEDDSTDL